MLAIYAANLDFVCLRCSVCSPRKVYFRIALTNPCLAIFKPAYFFFAEAFFEAFSGSNVVPPANPRRSRGGAFALEIRT